MLWVIRDVLWGEILLARTLLSATAKDSAALLWKVQGSLVVPSWSRKK